MKVDILIGALLLVSSVYDYKTHKVSKRIIILFMMIFILKALFQRELSYAEYCGGAFIGILIIIISKVSGGQIGTGDGYIFCLLGIGLGFWMNLKLLLLSHMIAGIYAIVLYIVKRSSKNTKFAFIPFIFISYIILLS